MDFLEREMRSPWLFFGVLIVVVGLLLTLAVRLQLDASVDSLAPTYI